jgi:Fe2+ or Zn2+ uptake regulation protein
MAITRDDFKNEKFEKGRRQSKQQIKVITFLSENNSSAFTTKEIAKELYGDDSPKSVTKAYYLLRRLNEKKLVERKMPYWTKL